MSQYILNDWPEDRLPTCSFPLCRREIRNGEHYTVVPDTIKFLCSDCAPVVQDMLIEEEQEHRDLILRSKPKPTVLASRATHVRSSYERAKLPPKPPKPSKPPRLRKSLPSCAWCGAPCLGRGGRNPQHRYCSLAHFHRHRVILKAAEHERRKIPCPGCGEIFDPIKHRYVRKFCGVKCAGLVRRMLGPRICRPCGRSFYPARGTQTYCSQSCHAYGLKGRKNPQPPLNKWARHYDKCQGCGTTTRRHEGHGLCSRCTHKGRNWRRKNQPGETSQWNPTGW